MNHELTLAKINEKENPKSKIQTIKCYRIHTGAEEGKERASKEDGENHNSTNCICINNLKKYLMSFYSIPGMPLGAEAIAVIEKIKKPISYLYGAYIIVERTDNGQIIKNKLEGEKCKKVGEIMMKKK